MKQVGLRDFLKNIFFHHCVPFYNNKLISSICAQSFKLRCLIAFEEKTITQNVANMQFESFQSISFKIKKVSIVCISIPHVIEKFELFAWAFGNEMNG